MSNTNAPGTPRVAVEMTGSAAAGLGHPGAGVVGPVVYFSDV
jgi:hypothetical protein